MAGLYVSNLVVQSAELKSLSASSSGLEYTGVDLINCPGGAVLVNVYAITSGTGTSTITLEHSVNNSTWATVPAAAVLNNNTGVVTTLSTFSTTGTNQTVAVNRELLRRYLRITITGTTLTQSVVFSTVYLAANTATA
jgi:hypothetical protein